jgi:hypothetical protein
VAVATEEQRPIRLVVDDDLERSRLTVLFRLLLAIPHIVWVILWGIAALVATIAIWFVILVKEQAPDGLHGFVARYVRYATHVSAYVFLATNPYPGFGGNPGYAIDLEIAPPERQSRWSGLFRLFLALPAIALAAALGGRLSFGFPRGAAAIAAVLAWFAILALGRAPRGLRDLTAYAIGYGAQAGGYLLLLTPRYPSSDPVLAEPYSELPEHPLRVVVTDDLERPRLAVLFRLLLAIPHLLWLALWSIAAFFVAIAAWVAALVSGRVPSGLHRFLAAFVRYALHVQAYLYLVGRQFPGFTGRPGSYEVDLQIDEPGAQNRWKTLFRLFFALPALLLASALGAVVLVAAFLGWWYALVRGRMPEGLRNLGAACLRYTEQTTAYLILVTERYPYAAPVLRASPAQSFR